MQLTPLLLHILRPFSALSLHPSFQTTLRPSRSQCHGDTARSRSRQQCHGDTDLPGPAPNSLSPSAASNPDPSRPGPDTADSGSRALTGPEKADLGHGSSRVSPPDRLASNPRKLTLKVASRSHQLFRGCRPGRLNKSSFTDPKGVAKVMAFYRRRLANIAHRSTIQRDSTGRMCNVQSLT